MRPFWDRAFRSLLGRPSRLRALLSLCQPDLVERLDFEHLELLDRSFILTDFQQREADLVYRLPYQSPAGQQEVIVYILLEHQSTVDPWMPYRMLFYMMRVWDDQRLRIQAENGPARLSPIIPVVFYTGSREWKAAREFRELMDGPAPLEPFAPRFDIMYLELPEMSPAALEAIGPMGAVLRAVQRIDADHPEFKAVLERAARAIRPLLGDEWRELAEFLCLLITHRRPREEFPDLEIVLSKAAADRNRRLELIKMSESLADVLLKEGREEGLEKGREEGREKGREEGRIAACRAIILRLGRHRFGEPSAAYQARLEAFTDLSKLEAMCETVLEAANWDDLLPDR